MGQCHSVKRNLSFRGSDRCHCRGNPYSKRQRKRIAAPVCGLARNDKALNLMALLCGAFSFFGVFFKKARLKVERLFLTFSFSRAMIASWQTIVLYFMIAGQPVFLVLLLHTISGPSTARTISAPLRRTSRCIQKLTASSPNEAQRSGFGLDQEEQGSGRMTFL